MTHTIEELSIPPLRHEPEFIKSSRNNFIYYKPGDKKSINASLENAKKFDKNKIDVSEILSWDELTQKIIRE